MCWCSWLCSGDGWNTRVFVTLLLQRNRPLVSKTGLFAQSSSSIFMGVSVWLCHFVFSLTPFPGWTTFIFQMVTWLFWGFHLWNSEIQLCLCLYTSVVCRVGALIWAYEKKVPFYNFLSILTSTWWLMEWLQCRLPGRGPSFAIGPPAVPTSRMCSCAASGCCTCDSNWSSCRICRWVRLLCYHLS